MRIVHARDLPEQTQERSWLIEPYIPASEVSLLTGSRRSGKGLWCAHVASLASRGQRAAWDLAAQQPLTPHRVLWVTCSTSEDTESEIRNRVKAAGGDVNRLDIIGLDRDEGIEDLRPLLIDGGPNLLIIDPLQAVLGDLGAITARNRMEDLVGLARSTSTSVIAIRHITKSGSARGRGEIADVVRSQVYAGKHPDTPDLVVIAPAPSSYGDGEPLAFRIDQLGDGPALAHVAEDWDDNIHWNDLVPTPPRRRRARRITSRERAKSFLMDLLMAGPLPREEVVSQGRRRRLSERTIERAAAELGIRREGRREGGRISSSLWSLGFDEQDQPSNEPPAMPQAPQGRTVGPPEVEKREGPTTVPPSATQSVAPRSPVDEEDPDDFDPSVERFKRLDLD